MVVSVKIKSADSTPVASTSTDYFSADTTLSFADGESSKTFLVNLKKLMIWSFLRSSLVFIRCDGRSLGAITSAIAEIKDTDIDFTSTLKLLTKSTKKPAATVG